MFKAKMQAGRTWNDEDDRHKSEQFLNNLQNYRLYVNIKMTVWEVKAQESEKGKARIKKAKARYGL
jgi:hypothetical protein